MMCRKHMFLLTTVVQKAASRGLHVPGGAVELGGPTTSRAQMSKGLSLFLLVYLSGTDRAGVVLPLQTEYKQLI